ncbi:MAG: alanyl-tRNA editing protein [bacterium]|nr:alanyl-tRNA editing protein [bacterium]
MQTQLLYLEDSYQKSMDAQILEVIPESEGKYRVLLDKTVFYAMGGGQPTDQGVLSTVSWTGEVYQVMIKDGELWHYVTSLSSPTVGDSVQGTINWDRRYKNMRLHTAGHIIDFAMYLLGYTPTQLTPLKGDHGKKPYIVYQGVVLEDIQPKIQAKVDELIAQNLAFSWEFIPYNQLQKEAIYLQPNLPTNKPLRALRLETAGTVADGGTQLHSTAEVGKILVGSVEVEGETTVIKYSLPQ